MVGVWLLFTFFIPAATQQWVTTTYPANLMTDLIDAQRDERENEIVVTFASCGSTCAANVLL